MHQLIIICLFSDKMNGPLQNQIGKMELIKKGSANHLTTQKVVTIPHFVMDISVDGVKIANNTKIPSATPVVGRLHSVQPSASNDRGIRTSRTLYNWFSSRHKAEQCIIYRTHHQGTVETISFKQ